MIENSFIPYRVSVKLNNDIVFLNTRLIGRTPGDDFDHENSAVHARPESLRQVLVELLERIPIYPYWTLPFSTIWRVMFFTILTGWQTRSPDRKG